MIALDLLRELRSVGLNLEAVGDKLRVTPQGKLTPELRSRIVARKPDLFAAIDLEHRIREMAMRWRYSLVELNDVLEKAHSDPEKWARAVALDEQREQEFGRDKLPRKADA
ncbi:MAG: hypothetical protein ABL964_01145 [Steroidobacteraceae bacterium]